MFATLLILGNFVETSSTSSSSKHNRLGSLTKNKQEKSKKDLV